MKDWKVWAILLLACVVVFQYLELRDFEKLYSQAMRSRRQELDKVAADGLKTRLDNSKQFMVQMNCAQVESSLKQWNACVLRGIHSGEGN